MPVNRRNDEMVGLLATDFQRRWEPNFACGNAISTFMLLPRLRALWPCSSVDQNMSVYDVSGQGRTLTATPVVADGFDILYPYVWFPSGYLSRADEAALDFAGTITFGGWFWPNAGADQALIGKWGAAGQRSYRLIARSTNVFSFEVSGDGTNVVSVDSDPIDFNYPSFVVGKFSTGTEVTIFRNGVKAINTTGIPANMFNSTAPLEVGISNGAMPLGGSASMMFLCDVAAQDYVIESAFWQSQAMYGVKNG